MTAVSETVRAAIEHLIRSRLPGVDIERVEAIDSEDFLTADPMLRVRVVLTREERLDPQQTVSMVRHLRPVLGELGVETFPVITYWTKADADEHGFQLA